jgi:ATP-binding cassette subfamily B protein
MFVDVLFLGVLAFYRMWKMNVILTLASAIPLILMALCGGIIGKYMRKKFELRQKAYADLSDFAQESFSGIAVIKAFVKEGKELMAFSRINKDSKDKNLSFVKASTLLNIIVGLLISSVIIIIVGYGGYLIYTGALVNGKVFTIGRLTEYIGYFSALIWPMMAIAQLINLRSQASASLKRINELLNHEIDIKDVNVITNHEIEGKITFNHLHFAYPETDKDVLHDINFTIEKGESVGIVGRTGSGKTTLVDLLLRIHNLTENQLLIDDVDIMTLPFKKVREAIAYVPQDNFLFSDTILNNINFYNQTVNKGKVVSASKLADVYTNISEFKEGFDTMLGERGVTVSGGQKQRISIARALIKDAQILILDDSVSAVDTKTEEQILANLKQIRQGKTTILIAHRVSTVKQLDKIAIIDEGRIVGFGSHQELLADNALYQNMVRLQTLEDEVRGDVSE